MVTLRKVEPEDLPYLYQWENDASVWADGDTHNPLSHQDLRTYIENTTGDIYRDGQVRMIVEADNVTMGCIDLFDLDARNRKAAIGMYIAPEYRGLGIGRAAIQALEEHAFAHLGLRQIYAIISVNNHPCSQLYKSLGYESTAHLRAWTLEGDAVVWQKIGN